MSSPSDSHPSPPRALFAAAALVALQGLLTVVLGAVEAFSTHSDRVAMGLTTALFFLAYGAAHLLCAWGLATVRSWARGPVLLAELIWLGLAWNFRETDLIVLVALGALSAVAVLVCLLLPASVEELNR